MFVAIEFISYIYSYKLPKLFLKFEYLHIIQSE